MAKSAIHGSPHPIKAPRRVPTSERILDVAEELFSRYGLADVMLKDVAQAAGVHNTLLAYYFKDKQHLFETVITQRTPRTSERRMAALASYEREAAGELTVEGILRAYLDTDPKPDDSGWRHYGALGAQLNELPDSGAALIDAHFSPVVLRLVELLKKALPGCSDEDILWGCHFLRGALMLSLAQPCPINKLSAGPSSCGDVDAIRDRMVLFMAAGFKYVAANRDQSNTHKRSG
ncbi:MULTISPECIES: TetR/AcrR family transcriptional regulator [unclassified Sphingomonas]|uniref:TetR/AcrR family transcriptional regulator n=1 Tax=unclassified Sphingomonas TaxID=196159 RepID=UPI001D10740D|nr:MULTISPECIES: TetR/AcrR family transcriptional regulator [unclassified Sphingomonas]MCC2980045.1 TetR family transcriptional regulator [Sphingomonas sp. IC4-52]